MGYYLYISKNEEVVEKNTKFEKIVKLINKIEFFFNLFQIMKNGHKIWFIYLLVSTFKSQNYRYQLLRNKFIM